MINPIAVLRLRNSEFLGFVESIITICKKYNVPLPMVAGPVAVFETGIAPMKDVFAQERGNQLSEDIVRLDLRRDCAIVGIKLNCESYIGRHFEPAKVAAADTLLRAINKYGSNIAGQNYLQQTSILDNLSTDFEGAGPVKDALALLGLTSWANEMKQANEAFHAVYLERNAQQSQKRDGSLSEMRLPGKVLFENFVKVIHAHETLNPSADLDALIKEINALIAQFNLLLEKRTAKGDEEDETPGDVDSPTPA